MRAGRYRLEPSGSIPLITFSSRVLRGALLASLSSALAISGCKKDKPELPVIISFTRPVADGAAIHISDDEDAATQGIQYTVKVSVAQITSDAKVTLFLDGVAVPNAAKAVQQAGEVSFPKVTLPSGAHSLTAKLEDHGAGKSGQATRTINVEGATGCTFVSPADGATLDASKDEDPALAGEQVTITVKCVGLASGSPATLEVAAPDALGGQKRPATATSKGDGSIVFPKVSLGEGKNGLKFLAKISGAVALSAQASVTVSTGNCAVWLADPATGIFNAAGDPPQDNSDTRPVVADLDPSTPGVQASVTAFADTSSCPAGSTATVSFNGAASTTTATVGSDGKIFFPSVTLPDGDMVVTNVHVSAGAKHGDALPNTYGVDSVVPVLNITQPNKALLTTADDIDPAAGLQIQVGIHATSGIDASTQVGVLDSAATPFIAPQLVTLTPGGDYIFPQHVTLPSGQNVLTATAVRKLGNRASAAFTTTVDLTGAPPISLVYPTTTTVVCSHAPGSTVDEDLSSPTCELTMKVQVGANASSVSFSGGTVTNGAGTLDASTHQATFTFSLGQGVFTLSATVHEGARSATLATPVTVTVDTSAPTVAFTSPAPTDPVAARTFSSQTASVTVATTDAEVGQTITITSNPVGASGAGVVTASGSATISVSGIVDGSQTLNAVVSDAAGNVSSIATLVVVGNIPGCTINFTNPTTSTVSLNKATGAVFTVTGNTPTAGCGNQTITFKAASPPNGPVTTVGTATTASNGDFTFTYTFPDQATTQFIASMNVTQASSNSFTARVDTIAPVITFVAPVANSAGQLFVVTATGNERVAAGVPGYIPDADPTQPGAQLNVNISVANGGDANGTGTGTITISQGTTVLFTGPVSGNGTVSFSSPGVVPALNLAEGTSTFVVSVTDAAGNTTTVTDALRVKTTVPPPPTLVPSGTTLLNYHHADIQVTAQASPDPTGDPLHFEVGYANSTFVPDAGPFDNSIFSDPSRTKIVDTGPFNAPGSNTTATLTFVYPFNLYSVAARSADSVGNVSTVSVDSKGFDTYFPSTTIAYTGPAAANAQFGEFIEVGDIDKDGVADIAIQAAESDNSGSIQVVYGTNDGGTTFTRQQRFQGAAAGAYFGNPFALGDLNGDGAADLAAYDTDHISIYLSSGGQLPLTPSVTITGEPNLLTMRVVPDITGDGIADLVFNNPGAGTANQGRIYVIRGRTTWPTTLLASSADIIINGTDANGRLGNDIGVGPTGFPRLGGGTGPNELVVPASRINKVYFFKGDTLNAKGVNATTADALATFTSASEPSTSNYGESVHAYDANHDLAPDLLVGDLNTPGFVFAYLQANNTFTSTSTTPPYITGGGNIGTNIVDGDLNGDGLSDLVLGRAAANNSGGIYIYNGRNGSLPSNFDATLLGSNGFGAAVQVADVTGDGYADLIVGVIQNGNGNVQVFH
jgi:hypothetical protein